MGYKREDIRDTSPLSMKKLNDNFRHLWFFTEDVKTNANGKLGLIYVGRVVVPNNNEYVTIQLPSNFKNTMFYASVSAANIENTAVGYSVKNFTAEPYSYDRANGTFVIHGLAESFNVSTPGTVVKNNITISYTVIA